MSAFIPEIIKGGITAGEIAAGAIAGATVAGNVIANYPKGADGYYIPQYDPSRGGYYLPGYSSPIKPGMILPNGKVFNPPAYAPGTGILAPSGGSGGVVIPGGFKPYNSSVDEIKKAINKIIGSSSDSVIRYRYPKAIPSNIKSIKDSITSNPKFIDDIIDIVGTDLPKGTKADDILKIVAGDEAKRKAILEALKGLQLPDAPVWIDDKGSKPVAGQPDSGDPSGPDSTTTAVNGIKDKINQTTKESGGTTTDPLEVTKTSGENTNQNKGETKTNTKTDTDTKTKTDTDTKTKEEEEDDEEPKPPPPDDKKPPEENKGITERPISSVKQKMNVQRQWLPEYNFGGQNILKLTDVEKLEELKHYTLFD